MSVDLSVLCSSTLSVNTVDVLYVAFPALLYLNPELAGYLLSPLLEYQDSPAHTLSYAARNIGELPRLLRDLLWTHLIEGSSYPSATADVINFSHDYGVEGSLMTPSIVPGTYTVV